MAGLDFNILVNNKRAVFVKQIGNKCYFALPNVAEVSTVEISSNTFNPEAMVMGQDSRDLGVDIKSIRLFSKLNGGPVSD